MSMKVDDLDEIPWVDTGTDVEIIKDLNKRVCQKTTPDFIDRKLERDIPVFVYGTLKTGGFFSHILEGAPFLGDAHTDTSRFFMKETDSFPVVFEGATNKKAPVGKVFGELYVVDPKRLLELDRLESNGYMYQREQVWVKLLDQPSAIMPHVKAWMYIGIPHFWNLNPLSNVKAKESSAGLMYEWSKKDRQVLLI